MTLSRRQARQLTDTAYLAAATALLWVGLYYLPVGGALFRLALPLPLALLQLRHNGRCAVEGVTVTALLLVALVSSLFQALAVPPSVEAAAAPGVPRWWIGLAGLALVLVFGQCLLGAGMASQWAADQCLAVGDGCHWLLAHRQLATPAALGVGLLALTGVALPSGSSHLQGLAWGAAALVVVQVVLGVSTLRLELQQPLVTVAHQVVAADLAIEKGQRPEADQLRVVEMRGDGIPVHKLSRPPSG